MDTKLDRSEYANKMLDIIKRFEVGVKGQIINDERLVIGLKMKNPKADIDVEYARTIAKEIIKELENRDNIQKVSCNIKAKRKIQNISCNDENYQGYVNEIVRELDESFEHNKPLSEESLKNLCVNYANEKGLSIEKVQSLTQEFIPWLEEKGVIELKNEYALIKPLNKDFMMFFFEDKEQQ